MVKKSQQTLFFPLSSNVCTFCEVNVRCLLFDLFYGLFKLYLATYVMLHINKEQSYGLNFAAANQLWKIKRNKLASNKSSLTS